MIRLAQQLRLSTMALRLFQSPGTSKASASGTWARACISASSSSFAQNAGFTGSRISSLAGLAMRHATTTPHVVAMRHMTSSSSSEMQPTVVQNAKGGGKSIRRFLVACGANYVIWWLWSHAVCPEQQVVPYTGRKRTIHVSSVLDKPLEVVGKFRFEWDRATAQAEGTLLEPDHPYSQAVRRVGEQLVSAADSGEGGAAFRHTHGLKLEYAVIDSDNMNAGVLQGGKVVVYSGMLRALGSEDELAAVLAHELAHVVARHHMERMSDFCTLSFFDFYKAIGHMLVGFLGVNLIAPSPYTDVILPQWRLMEFEADAIGLQLMAAACYDPKAAQSMMQKMCHIEWFSGSSGPPELSTHPPTEQRVQHIREGIPQAKRLFTECGCERLALHKRMWKALKSEAAWNAMHLAAQQWRPAAAS